MKKNNENLYLKIARLDDNKIEIDSSDGVFTSFGTMLDEDYFDYCDRKADEWLSSKLGNYDGWSKKDRKAIADKWTKAKELHEGIYDYYFNLQDTTEIFREAVKKLAQGMGINYTLTINPDYDKIAMYDCHTCANYKTKCDPENGEYECKNPPFTSMYDDEKLPFPRVNEFEDGASYRH